MGNPNPDRRNKEIFSTLSLYRGLILDLAEQTTGQQAIWPALRSRLLSLLGEKGLEGRLRDILKDEVSPQLELGDV